MISEHKDKNQSMLGLERLQMTAPLHPNHGPLNGQTEDTQVETYVKLPPQGSLAPTLVLAFSLLTPSPGLCSLPPCHGTWTSGPSFLPMWPGLANKNTRHPITFEFQINGA